MATIETKLCPTHRTVKIEILAKRRIWSTQNTFAKKDASDRSEELDTADVIGQSSNMFQCGHGIEVPNACNGLEKGQSFATRIL
jgi:hypothetical protein